MDPSWDDLKVFLAVARDESLSAAGRRLRVDPATVGRRIARLEEVLGVVLFAKSPQGYALTNEGHKLLSHAEAAEAAVESGREALATQAGQLTGTIRIGAPDGCANFLLPQVCTEIAEANPDLEIQIVALPRVVNLSKREVDMAIAVSPPETGKVSVQKLTDYKLSLAGARQYLRRHAPIETMADLEAHRIVGYIPDMIFDKELDYLAELGLPAARSGSNSASVQFQWILRNGGLGIVHDFAIASTRILQKVLPGQVELTRAFYLVRHEEDRRLERMNRLAEMLADGIRAEVARLEAQA